MQKFSNELLNAIIEDRANGLTYVQIVKKHNLKSDYAIRVALGVSKGNDVKYINKHVKRYRELLEIEKKYYALLKEVKQ